MGIALGITGGAVAIGLTAVFFASAALGPAAPGAVVSIIVSTTEDPVPPALLTRGTTDCRHYRSDWRNFPDHCRRQEKEP
jgi:hypothetical protein